MGWLHSSYDKTTIWFKKLTSSSFGAVLEEFEVRDALMAVFAAKGGMHSNSS